MPVSYPLAHEFLVERALLGLPDKLQGEGNLTKCFVLVDRWSRTPDHKVFQATTLSTRPRRSHRRHPLV